MSKARALSIGLFGNDLIVKHLPSRFKTALINGLLFGGAGGADTKVRYKIEFIPDYESAEDDGAFLLTLKLAEDVQLDCGYPVNDYVTIHQGESVTFRVLAGEEAEKTYGVVLYRDGAWYCELNAYPTLYATEYSIHDIELGVDPSNAITITEVEL